MIVHLLVVTMAVLAVVFAARFPRSSVARSAVVVPTFSFSGLSGSTQSRELAFIRPAYTNQTSTSSAALTTRADSSSIRAAGGVSPTASFSSGVAAAAATNGEASNGVTPLADVIDPQHPFLIHVTQANDTVSGIAAQYGVKVSTILLNNAEVTDGDLIQPGQQIIVPRKDGILYKIKANDTVDSIVKQYDNITADQVVAYKPNAISDPNTLKQGDFLLLEGATLKPPPPPPPPPPPRPSSSGGSSGGSGGSPAPGANGIFHYPLAHWQGVSDPFGVDPEFNRFHTGIDLDLYRYPHSSIFAACTGTVSTVEYLTYSYGYHVIIDCDGGGGFSTLYAHMSEIDVNVGQHVTWGTQVGVSGVTGFTTGEHLHFEIRINGSAVNPQDYLDFGPLE